MDGCFARGRSDRVKLTKGFIISIGKMGLLQSPAHVQESTIYNSLLFFLTFDLE